MYTKSLACEREMDRMKTIGLIGLNVGLEWSPNATWIHVKTSFLDVKSWNWGTFLYLIGFLEFWQIEG